MCRGKVSVDVAILTDLCLVNEMGYGRLAELGRNFSPVGGADGC